MQSSLLIERHLIGKINIIAVIFIVLVMEKAQTGIVYNSESSSTISCIDRINIELANEITIDTTDNELSKEREEELLFGDDEGDDEDVLSDDSLRLRLSDDEDVEQEDNTTNSTSITEIKLQDRKPGI